MLYLQLSIVISCNKEFSVTYAKKALLFYHGMIAMVDTGERAMSAGEIGQSHDDTKRGNHTGSF